MAYNRILMTDYGNRRNYYFYADCSKRMEKALVEKLSTLLDLMENSHVTTDLIEATINTLGPMYRAGKEHQLIYKSASVEVNHTFASVVSIKIYKPRKFIRAANKVLISTLQNTYQDTLKANNKPAAVLKWRLRTSNVLFKTDLIEPDSQYIYHIKRKISGIEAFQARIGKLCVDTLMSKPNAPVLMKYLHDNSLLFNALPIKGGSLPDGTHELHFLIKDISKFADDAYVLAYELCNSNTTKLPPLPETNEILDFIQEGGEIS